LGKEYVYRPKSGFGIPIDEWLKDDQTGYLRDTLLLTPSPIYKYVERSFVQEIVEEHLSGGRNHCDKIWNLLMLDGWFQCVYSDKVQKDA
jgi:asparagine synthase (glutamine-hydrolysing)